MWKRNFTSVVVGTLVLCLGHFLFWVLLPQSFSDPTLSKTLSPTHALASPTSNGWILLALGNTPPNSTTTMGLGLLQHLLSALFMTLLVAFCVSRQRLVSLEARFLFVVTVGSTAALGLELMGPLWLHRPWHPHLFNVVAQTGCWLLAAAPIAAMVRLQQQPFPEQEPCNGLPLGSYAKAHSQTARPVDWLRAACAATSSRVYHAHHRKTSTAPRWQPTPSRESGIHEPPLPKLSLPAI
ncbi:MAG: hypothetical protein EP343_15140 [Deltaproteobacteria bacterium]|nr:MAG: hypothetical protein EP343_15140 [Deltaproteobacteria bacterium]